MATPTVTVNQSSAIVQQLAAVSVLEQQVPSAIATSSAVADHESIATSTAADWSDDQVIEEILAAVHKHDFYPDNKDFVDSPYTANPTEVHAYFKQMVNTESRESVAKFLEKYYDPPACELVSVVPEDWTPTPKAIAQVKNEKYRNWAEKLNEIWLELCRQVKPKVKENPDRYSLIYVPHTFVAPGGRFREFYYWDTYWVVKGLIACEMYETAKQVIRNFAYIVDLYGFIPNGQRKYYLNRSQPPLFIPMAYDCYKATHDLSFLQQILPALVAEYNWWFQNRTISVTSPSGKTHEMFRYFSSWKQPRPESYMADIHTASEQVVLKDRENMFQHIAAAAESGWDFSSRWFADGTNMKTIATALIAPVDLNAFICNNAKILSELHDIIGNSEQAEIYAKQHRSMVAAFNDVFWNEDEGAWFDYYIDRQTHNKMFFGSMVAPIFAKCYEKMEQVERAYAFIKKAGAISYDGGVPASLQETGQQWDFPNAWSPLVHMLIVGLKETSVPKLEAAAKQITGTWLSSNYRQFERTRHMFEKYNVASKLDGAGTGGEYTVQTGFGWSNGTVLDLLAAFQDEDWSSYESETTL